jgi:hypothetical protein
MQFEHDNRFIFWNHGCLGFCGSHGNLLSHGFFYVNHGNLLNLGCRVNRGSVLIRGCPCCHVNHGNLLIRGCPCCHVNLSNRVNVLIHGCRVLVLLLDY